MNKKLFQSGKSLLSKLCLTSLLLIGMGNTAWADELTVNGGASNISKYLPIYVEAAASYNAKGEYIIPSSLLGSVVNKKITKLSYEVSTKATATGQATYAVYLEETNTDVYPSSGYDYLKTNSATLVYSGALNATAETMDIEFTSNFVYSGNGNLLVHIECTSTGNEGYPYFRGKSDWSNYRGLYTGSATSNTRSAFVPKTTITYEAVSGQTNPKLVVSPSTIDFGSLRASATKTVTVTNTGVGTMDVTIDNNNTTDFTVSTTSLTGIGEGDSKTFDVTFKYDAANLGDKTASITVTPSYDAADVKTIAVTATAADASVWEDFSEGVPPTWYNQNSSWLTNVSGMNGMASPGMKSTDILRTPRLYAEAGEEIGYDVKIGGTASSYKIKAQYTSDGITWTDIATYTTTNTYTFAAPETGYYWLRFTGYQSGIDNFTGWSIADPIHYTILGSATIPTTGTVHGDYTAKVDVMELGGSEENITAELYFGETKVAEEDKTIGGNRDETITITFELTEKFSGEAYIKVTGDNIGTLTTPKKTVNINEPSTILDEESEEHPTCVSSVIKVKYTAQKGWNTIVMPFQLSGSPTYMDNIFGTGWSAYTLENYNEGTLTFKRVSAYNNRESIAYSTPLLVYAPNAEPNTDGIYFKGVSIYTYAWASQDQTVGNATFKGTFSPIAAPGMDGKYGLTPDGKIVNGNASANIKGYRAYFEFAEGSTPAKLSIVIDENDAPTLIGAIQMMEDNAAVYDMMGRKVETLNGKVVSGQLPKGIYIVNGKKVIVK